MLKIRHILLCAVVVAANSLNFSVAQPPAEEAASTAPALTAADETFVRKAAIVSLTELTLGQLAAVQGTQDDVRKFGAAVATDNAKLNRRLTELAEQQGWELPADIDADHRAKIGALSEKDDLEFTMMYADEMVSSQRRVVELYRDTAQHSQVPALRNFAREALPTMERHLQMAQSLQQAVANR
jgi:putative membrane protein